LIGERSCRWRPAALRVRRSAPIRFG
jgi:hypothetical protein